jgi:methionyl-tRNA formyltransferase
MMKNILVVSDNAPLVKFFQDECAGQNVQGLATVEYRYSARNKNAAAIADLGATPIDMKDPGVVAGLKSTYDLIISVHCKTIFPADLVEAVRCINVHPGMNPYNRGWYPQVFAIMNGTRIGATIHLMDKEVDHGEIIAQLEVQQFATDTSFDLYSRVIEAEKELIRTHLVDIINDIYCAVAPASEGNYNSIQDFNALCGLDLDGEASLREHINLLRALSHGNFKNAFFRDGQGKKIFVRVSLEEE